GWTRLSGGGSSDPQTDPKRRPISARGRRESRQKHCAAVAVRGVDHVGRVPRVPAASRAVRRLLEDHIRDRVVEKDLRRELEGLVRTSKRPDLEMDVDRAALVPARIDGRECDGAVRIRYLVPAQEALADPAL